MKRPSLLFFSVSVAWLILIGFLVAGSATPTTYAELLATATSASDEESPAAVAQAAATPTLLPTPTLIPDNNCIDCHNDAELLQELAEEEEVAEAPSEGSGWGGSVPPLEVWERVLINAEMLLADVHGYVPCTDCHGGQNVEDKHEAHDGMVRDPSIDAEASCGSCHPDIAPFQEYSLHNNLAGYDTVLYERSIPENHAIIEEGQSYHCNDCHTTCGQCHVSQPTSVGGGLIDGHLYNRTPSMTRQCTACHGSRVKDEYTGAHEGLSPDVHLRIGRMVCTDCHSGGDMHGTDHIVRSKEDSSPPAHCDEGAHNSDCESCHEDQVGIGSDNPAHEAQGMVCTDCHLGAEGPLSPAHRYDGAQGPTCESCHEDQVGIGSDNPYHEAHGTEILSCQACHSVSYSNCYQCHLERTEEDVPYFRLEDEELGFFIGRNPVRTSDRPYRYVPVRHVPTWPDLFALYGENVFPNFEALPTWTYATPHNIQRNTPQTAGCEGCHGNNEFFLTADNVRPEELEQNASIIVPEAPALPDPLPEGYELVAPPEVEPTVDPYAF